VALASGWGASGSKVAGEEVEGAESLSYSTGPERAGLEGVIEAATDVVATCGIDEAWSRELFVGGEAFDSPRVADKTGAEAV
jgi:hypothetical protein